MSQIINLRKLAISLAMFTVVVLASFATAKADIVVTSNVINDGTDNVLLNPATNVLTVTGTVGQNNLLVNFTSTSGTMLLNADPSGQATVSGGTGNVNFTNIDFGLANNSTFLNAVFNINSNNNGMITLMVSGVNITGGTFSEMFAVNANGQNFFSVRAINGQLITNIDITAGAGVTFEDLRQVRLGGGAIVPPQAIPEPASMLLLGTGLIGVAGAARRRFKGRS